LRRLQKVEIATFVGLRDRREEQLAIAAFVRIDHMRWHGGELFGDSRGVEFFAERAARHGQCIEMQ
jgi:hypothetical protein